MLISLLQLLNIKTFVGEQLQKEAAMLIYAILFLGNTVIFYRKDKFKIITIDNRNGQLYMYWINGAYIALTMAFFSFKFWQDHNSIS